MQRLPLWIAVFVSLASWADAQSFNMRYASQPPVPAPTFGAATGQAGTWNALGAPNGGFGAAVSTNLVDLAGLPTSAVTKVLGCDHDGCGPLGFGPDIDKLFAGFVNGDCYLDPSSTTIEGLLPGHYRMTLYGASCHPSLKTVGVSLSDGSFASAAQVGGSYLGSFTSMTLGVVEFELASGVSVKLNGSKFGYLSALQLTHFEAPTPYCSAKLNSQGCQAGITFTGGTVASLSASSAFIVGCSQVVTDASGLLFYGTAANREPFLGGWLCVAPPTKRTVVQNAGNTGSACSGRYIFNFNAYLQSGGDPSVQAGQKLFGQYWYRDPSDPLGFGSATSNAMVFSVAP